MNLAPTRRSQRAISRAAAVVVIVLSAAACASSDSAKSADPDTTALEQMFPSDFEPACRNNPVTGATPYDPARAGIHKVVLLAGTSVDDLSEGFLDLPSEWMILFDTESDQYATAELVLCVVRTTTTLVKECTGYESDGVETDNVVKLYSAEYDVSAHEATTGAEVGRSTVSAIADECPMFVSFTEGERTRDWFETDAAAVAAFARPFAET